MKTGLLKRGQKSNSIWQMKNYEVTKEKKKKKHASNFELKAKSFIIHANNNLHPQNNQ